MATPTVSDDPTVQRHYLTQATLAATLGSSVRGLWELVTPIESAETFASGAHALLEQFSQASTWVARDHYVELRRNAGVEADVRIDPTPPPTRSRVDAGVGWALKREQEDTAAEFERRALERIETAMQNAMLDASRTQLVDAVAGDEKALGFRRVARPGACYFCVTLAIRSSTRQVRAIDVTPGQREKPGELGGERHFGVYKSRATAGQLPPGTGQINRYHDDCRCTVEPIFSAADTGPEWLNEMADLYDTFDEDKFGKGLNGFRKALKAHRDGEEYEPFTVEATTAATPPREQIEALLGRLDAATAA